jgi:heme-degrading monooxygenase HmoA
MSVYSVWESNFQPEDSQDGRATTEAVWRDMTRFDGYVTHELIEDLDDPGHLLVVSQWTTREHSDEAVRDYATHPSARHANELVTRPRTRFVGQAVPRAQ